MTFDKNTNLLFLLNCEHHWWDKGPNTAYCNTVSFVYFWKHNIDGEIILFDTNFFLSFYTRTKSNCNEMAKRSKYQISVISV